MTYLPNFIAKWLRWFCLINFYVMIMIFMTGQNPFNFNSLANSFDGFSLSLWKLLGHSYSEQRRLACKTKDRKTKARIAWSSVSVNSLFSVSVSADRETCFLESRMWKSIALHRIHGMCFDNQFLKGQRLLYRISDNYSPGYNFFLRGLGPRGLTREGEISPLDFGI